MGVNWPGKGGQHDSQGNYCGFAAVGVLREFRLVQHVRRLVQDSRDCDRRTLF
jgi:hypothetical protein